MSNLLKYCAIVKMLPVIFIALCSSFVVYGHNAKQEHLESWGSLLKQNLHGCISETKVNEEDVSSIDRFLKFPDYRNFKCFTKCIVKRLQLLDDNGDFMETKIKANVRGIDEQVYAKCYLKASYETDLCDRVYIATQCTAGEILTKLAKN
ncbi:hypothetical protein FQA39_LY05056 [Lamprigera yunnana]|nr:hypothetical protein FQA39_LY05056 [Lamprigera yunnana]